MSFPLGSSHKPNRLSAKATSHAGLRVGQCVEGDQKTPLKFFKLKYVIKSGMELQKMF